jgi:hypothetical protein
MSAHNDLVDLEQERERSGHLLQRLDHGLVALPLAATVTLHQMRGPFKATVTRAEYDDALDIAASALSRLVEILTCASGSVEARVVTVDLTCQRFSRGASQLRGIDGRSVDRLFVWRGELLAAIPVVRRAGPPFSFAIAPRAAPEGDARAQGMQ